MSLETDSVSAAMRLLKAVAGELQDLANDTARFGETLAEHGGLKGDDAAIKLMQKFDLFTQSLQAHAVLIERLSGHSSGETIGEAELNELLRHVPFFGVRQRLKAVVAGSTVALAEPEKESGDFWFFTE